MNRNLISIIIIVIATLLLTVFLVTRESHEHGGADHGHGHGHGHDAHEEEMPRGPHGGRILQKEGFELELTIFEHGVPPEMHVYPYLDGKPIAPKDVELKVRLHRTGNKTDDIGFTPQQDYLKGDTVIYEPHSFEVEAMAAHAGKSYQWRYENFEGRTQIPESIAAAMGVKTETVGPATIRETRTFSGQVHTDPNLVSRVRPRYAGVVKSIRRELGEVVKAGEVLASIQSNESLQTYMVKAPIAGLIVKRDIQVGETTGDDPLFVIVDLSNVWIELDIFSRDLDKVKRGQNVVIETLAGEYRRDGTIEWISPLATHASQSVRARIQLDNQDGMLRPGQFIRGHVTVAEHNVALSVKQSAIQSFRDFKVVYAKFADTYEVRMLELGRMNSEWAEVLDGIEAGTEYVTQNSYLVKADIEKSGASHDH